MVIKKRNQQNKRNKDVNEDPKYQDESIEFLLNLSTSDNISFITNQKKEVNKILSGEKYFIDLFDFDFENSIFYSIKENENLGILSFNQNSNDMYLEHFLNDQTSAPDQILYNYFNSISEIIRSFGLEPFVTKNRNLKKLEKEERDSQLITNTLSDQFDDLTKHTLKQENPYSDINSLEGNIYTKLYWTDLGSFFINLLYSKLGLELPELVENRDRTTIPNTRNQMIEIKKSPHKLESKNFDLNSDKFNIITSNEADIITNQYNADALTIGNNIFISQNKFDLTSPQGIGLLIHELVHVKQIKERGKAISSEVLGRKGDDTMFKFNSSLQSLDKTSNLENEAIEQEERIISYMNYLQQNSFENPNNNSVSTSSSTSLNFPENPFFSNSFPSDYKTFNYPFATVLNDILSNLNLSKNIINNVNNKEHIIHNKGLINDNFIKPSIPLVTNSNLFKDHNTTDNYFSYLGQNIDNHVNSKSFTYSPVPILFASRDRTVNSISDMPNSIPDNAMNNNSQIQSNIPSESNPINSIPYIDIEYLADKVYSIFQNKIQIQKMRRGIS